MVITFDSSVILVNDFPLMKRFYTEILQKIIKNDFGNCIGLEGGLSLWKLAADYPIAEKLGYQYHLNGNKNLEICFTCDDINAIYQLIQREGIKFFTPLKRRLGDKEPSVFTILKII